MDMLSHGRGIMEILEQSYRYAERVNGRPERAGTDEIPEPTDVDAQAARQAAAELVASGTTMHSWEDWLRISWFPYLRQFPGFERRIGAGWEINDHLARFPIDGDLGRLFVTTRFDSAGHLVGLSESTRAKQEGEPPSSVTIACPPEHVAAMKAFYKSVLSRDLPCREAGEPYVPPRWPDPAYPQQMHLDVFVADLDAAAQIASAKGGRLLQDVGSYRIYADPRGHPLCFYRDTTGRTHSAGLGMLARIVIDCPDPLVLAEFYGKFLRMPVRIMESADRVVIARDADTFPMLAFQRVDNYVAPRWPDPAYPAQMHFDLGFDDRAAAERRAIELGATWIRPYHKEHFAHVYADPAGHPFCLLEPGD